MPVRRRLRLRRLPIMPWRRLEWPRSARPVPDSLKRFAAARLLFCLGIRWLLFGYEVREPSADGRGGEAACAVPSLFPPPGRGGFGISTVLSVRPSERGGDSTVATSARSVIA